MKIGLITYHHSNNYGAVLQSYATYKALSMLGHEVELINIRQTEKKKIRHVVFGLKNLQFKMFMRKFYPKETPYIDNIQSLKKIKFKYDCLLVGSDQVWNPNISQDKCLAYFLDFGPNSIRRISYASSFGISIWPPSKEYLIPDITKALQRFYQISVRENTGKELLLNKFNINATVVVDPTMLHYDYSEITGDIKYNQDIICYLLNRTKEQFEISKYISAKLNTPLKLISNIYPIKGFKYVYPPSIKKWIQYIGGAKFVITDSFHGAVFSLLYKRNFIVVAVENGRNSRLIDLLKTVGLENRYITNLNEAKSLIDKLGNIDYSKIDPIINANRKHSWDFLKNSLA